jgi:hypothetical protein
MASMKFRWPTLRLALIIAMALAVFAAIPPIERSPLGTVALAQSSVELEEYLFVQEPMLANGKAGIHVLWLPAPLVKYCLGKTSKQCATIDYCIRTSNRDVTNCKNLGINLSRIPPYPPGIRPARELSVVYFLQAPIEGMDLLKKFYASGPRASLQRLSMDARIKARVKFTRKTDDDDFYVLEFLATPPF